MGTNGHASRDLLRLIDAIRGRRTSLIQVHNNPDPDAIGAAMGMRELYVRYLGIGSRIVFGGIVGRAENRAMLRLLGVEILPLQKADYDQCDLLTLVDTQPGFGHTPLPKGRVPEVVIDHHPEREAVDGILFRDTGKEVGATSTIVAGYFLHNGVPFSRETATALMYGIKSDTHDLSEDSTPADLEAYRHLLTCADMVTLSRIENARVPRSYYAVFGRAIENAVVYGFACVSNLGRIDNADMVAEMADFLLRCEGLRWTMVLGIVNKTLHFSLRSASRPIGADDRDESAHAGAVARKAVGVMGRAGGHGHMAGGQVPLGDADKKTRQGIVQAVTDLFLDAVHAKRSLAKPLTGGALPDETDTSFFEE